MSDEILDFECPTCGEAVTTNIVITRCGRCGGCPPASATKPREYVSDAVKLAREVIAAASCCNSVPLARAVIAQDEELAKLRAALAEALRYLDDQPSVGTAADVARIAELRRLASGE